MEQSMTLRFSHYEDEELAALAQQLLKQKIDKTAMLTEELNAFNTTLKRAETDKRKERKRRVLENTLASLLD
ncbi:hypothetical protein [Arachidicoccus sp.]|jgi:hypothetical protein|uniref:hypothetical protein n=1 Tax=Arachidicoccus sp. TaxID=1872624 RepID=UPI003D1AC467